MLYLLFDSHRFKLPVISVGTGNLKRMNLNSRFELGMDSVIRLE